MLIYCDSVVLIYYLDQIGPFNLRAANRIAALRAAGDQVAVSDLSGLECRVGPIKRGDATILAVFDHFFKLADVHNVLLLPAVFDRATYIRARHNFKTVDAIHLAAAVDGGCGRFLTNDAQLTAFPDLPVEILS